MLRYSDMRSRLLVAAALCLVSAILPSARADPSSSEKAFLTIPDGQRITPNGENPLLTDPPKDLLVELSNYNFGKANGAAPGQLHGFAFDLKHDGRKEFFVSNPAQSGSGGVGYMVFAEISKKWSLIGEFQGAIYALPTRKGWPRLVTIGRGGAESWSKTYSEFKDGKYKDKMIERYERGTVTKEPVEEE